MRSYSESTYNKLCKCHFMTEAFHRQTFDELSGRLSREKEDVSNLEQELKDITGKYMLSNSP